MHAVAVAMFRLVYKVWYYYFFVNLGDYNMELLGLQSSVTALAYVKLC